MPSLKRIITAIKEWQVLVALVAGVITGAAALGMAHGMKQSEEAQKEKRLTAVEQQIVDAAKASATYREMMIRIDTQTTSINERLRTIEQGLINKGLIPSPTP